MALGKPDEEKGPLQERAVGLKEHILSSCYVPYPPTSIPHWHPIFFPKVFMAGITIVLAIKNKLKCAIPFSMLRGEGGRVEREEERIARTQLRKREIVREGRKERTDPLQQKSIY